MQKKKCASVYIYNVPHSGTVFVLDSKVNMILNY